MKSLLTNDVVVRAFKTFVQAFLATLAVGVATVSDFESAKALLVGALAAAISAVWNSLKR
jgi:hypothetical protein